MRRKKVEITVVKVGFVILSVPSARRRGKILKIVLRIVFRILSVEA
jgi:hypothetical protein